MALRLHVLTASIDPPPSILVKGRRAVIGRSEECEVRIPDPSVSRIHATIVKRGAAYLITDEGSRQGTGVATHERPNPVWLAADSPRVIEEGEHIWVGQIELLASLEAAARGSPTGYAELPRLLVHAGLSAAGIEPTDARIESTLQELTELPEEDWEEPEPSAPEPVGVAALRDDDCHPPWKTDVFVAAVALLFFAGCAAGLWQLMSFG